jgi:hypothetical protein
MEHVDLAALDRKEYAITSDYHLPSLLRELIMLQAQGETLSARPLVDPQPLFVIGEPIAVLRTFPRRVDPNHRIRAHRPEPIPRRQRHIVSFAC